MLEFLRQLTSGIAEAWSRLSANAKVQISVSAILSLVLLGGAVYLGVQPQFAQLYNGLEQSETDQIRIYLEDQDIPYKIMDGGRAVQIPAKNISATRVYLAGQQIPKSQGVSPDFGIFDQKSLMTNKFMQNVDYQRAIQGTLQRHLNQFDFVRNSQVMIREAEEALFRDHQMPSEAVVLLELIGGELSPIQKKVLVHTISSFGGGNLSPNNITITTTTGDLIHSPVTDAYASLVSNRFEQEVAREEQKAEKIERAFSRFNKKVIIMVSAAHDWSTEDIKDTDFDKDRKVVVASMEKKMETTLTDGATANDGVPGAVANIPDTGGEVGNKEETTDNQTIENFEVGSTVTSTSRSVPVITSLSGSRFNKRFARDGLVCRRSTTPLASCNGSSRFSLSIVNFNRNPKTLTDSIKPITSHSRR